MSANGQFIWTDSLKESIVGNIRQVFFGPDKQPKFLFATSNNIFCLDENGQHVENFPVNLPDSIRVTQLSVFNTTQKSSHRLLVSDEKGHFYMFDREGNLQTGWHPKIMESPVAAEPYHLTINGKDVVLVLQRNGYVYAFNLRGDIYPGFPVDLGTTLAAGIFVQPGKSFRQSELTVISTAGRKFTINLAGRVVRRQQLPRRSNQSVFALLPAPAGKSYIVARQEPGKVSLYDQNQKLLLEKNFITSSAKVVQYFDFGPLNRIYVLTETGPRKTYLYNYKANLIGQQPLDNELPVELRFNPETQRYTIYIAYNKILQKLVFRD
jgi:DNA-binding beta-propeller fold protein YncE